MTMKNSTLTGLGIAAAMSLAPLAASAATSTVGPGGFDGGYATTITFEDDNTVARRGDAGGRDNPLNALGAPDGNFFEMGFGQSVSLTFGTLFEASTTIFEVTFGSAAAFPESVNVSVALGMGPAQMAGTVNNVDAQGGDSISLAGLMGPFDTVILTDTSPLSSNFQSDALGPLGGFDIDSVKVAPISEVPLPASGLLLVGAIAGAAAFGRRKNRG